MDEREIESKLDEYIELDWTLKTGTDLDFNKKEYFYIEIEEFPNFVYCAKTEELAIANYKKHLRLHIKIMLLDGEEVPEPGAGEDEIDWESLCP